MSENDEVDSKRVADAAKVLGEYFDAVEIVVTRHDPGEGTRTISKGCGNWHARLGLIHEWLINIDEQMREEGRSIARGDNL